MHIRIHATNKNKMLQVKSPQPKIYNIVINLNQLQHRPQGLLLSLWLAIAISFLL